MNEVRQQILDLSFGAQVRFLAKMAVPSALNVAGIFCSFAGGRLTQYGDLLTSVAHKAAIEIVLDEAHRAGVMDDDG